MSTLKVKQQKPADKTWTDEQGTSVPYDRTTKYEREAEKGIARIAKTALDLNERLTTFKNDFKATVEALVMQLVAENGGSASRKGKGNTTLYNFDRSIKVEVAVNEPIHFDEEFIKMAKAELDLLLEEELPEASNWIRGVIQDAFEKKKGELDTDKVLSLKKHASRTKNPRFHKAMQLIDKAINRPTSKEYFRVWMRGADGQFQNINLQFSAI